MNLNSKIQIIPGVGPKLTKKLEKLNIKTIKDLIYHFPRDWKDFTHPISIKGLKIDQDCIIKARVTSINTTKTLQKRMFLTRATLIDDLGFEILAVWFNQPYIDKYLKIDSTWLFSGKVGYDFQKRKKSLNNPIYTRKTQIIPVYPETEGINSKFLAKTIKIVLARLDINDYLPNDLLERENLIDLNAALHEIHFPSNIANLRKAKNRLAFNELFLLSLKMLRKRRKFKSLPAYEMKINKSKLLKLTRSLPFKLTGAQNKAIYDVSHDMLKNSPMTRLLNGDVGSGKTIVAAFASYQVLLNNYQSVWMAPTEILATQHYKNVTNLFKQFPDIKIGLLTSNKMEINDNQKSKDIKDKILNCDIVIGTHALIQKDIKFRKLGLIVVDEEHKFGVKQRTKLISNELQATSYKLVPHYLSMTATPIPRTLAISIYADLDISVIDELPPGRLPIITRVVSALNRQKAYDFIRNHIKHNRQAFVVCPLIEEKNNNKSEQLDLLVLDKKSVKAEFDKLSKHIFPDLRIGILHGKMKSELKEKTMRQFVDQEIDILVSTSVIEVGVDVPNANIMIIEDADRFGLAQLHQFRGRIGRGKHQSFCLLFTNSTSQKTEHRLQAMEKYSDGFTLANIDLKTRGPGEMIGKRQSGFDQLKIASLSDTITLKKARDCAHYILNLGLENFPKLNNIIK